LDLPAARVAAVDGAGGARPETDVRADM
jgi:hypothetical protein